MNTIHINDATLIKLLTHKFRYSISEIISSIPDSDDFIFSLTKKLGNIRDYKCWHQFCTAMDLVEDTQYAKENFQRFDIKGPTRYEDLGEKYLRLYGILNALYLQRSAVLEIAKYSNNGNIDLLKTKIDNCTIVKLRHAAAAHNLLCKDANSQNIYMTSQIDLENGNAGLLDLNNDYKVEDIANGIIEFDKIIIVELNDSTKRLLPVIPNSREGKGEIKAFLKHVNEYLKGNAYIDFGNEYSYYVGM